jgi:hypothetical protein
MKEVHELLCKTLRNEAWRQRPRLSANGIEDYIEACVESFIDAAWGARMDFAPFRENIQRARELSTAIEHTASKLADLLRKIQSTGCDVPSEFFSVRDLLCSIDTPGNGWSSVRSSVTAELAPATRKGGPPPITMRVRVGPPHESAEHSTFNAERWMRYAWTKAPTLDVLLDRMAFAARYYAPKECQSSRRHYLVRSGTQRAST